MDKTVIQFNQTLKKNSRTDWSITLTQKSPTAAKEEQLLSDRQKEGP